ncbi:class I adenylate-forming enzyme family protein [Microbispora sp. NBRC 16548]|uniref:class I adenylate-forming enzyme family protein n=1 Tax=Microbispora sp. NBRC 16548 TaxID=3030994 RepID=UPI0024A4673D|nr:class I adenylate-forming enzyme family protein [Microbispora sp. NBRC 16548]GLX11156.1 AMP-dependent synthetase [Microbispora sp. NBRC 16548]
MTLTEPDQPVLLEVSTVGELLYRAAARWPGREAIVFPDERATFPGLLQGAEQAARSLLSLSVGRGDRVGILMPNRIAFLEVLFGCHLIGAVPVTINARYKPKELLHVVRDAGLSAIVTTDVIADHAPFVDLLARAFAGGRPPALRHLVMLGTASPPGYVDRAAWEQGAVSRADVDVHALAGGVGGREIAVIMYTSGTTSSPRGCPLSHQALVRTALCAADRFSLTEDERFWDPLPLFHMAGLLPMVANISRGGAMLSMLHFKADVALRQLVEERATFAYPAFPTITQALVHHPDFAAADLSRIRGILETGPADYLCGVEAAFPGAKVVSSYGLTEAGGVITYSHLEETFEERIGTTGRPFPGMRVRIVDPETGLDCPAGVQGEIRVTGPGMFEGYLNDPVYTAERTDEQGFLCTGDLGALDEQGRVIYTGRLKDMLKVGGENVAAAEIEAHLGQHPAVKIAQVVGVSDARLIEVPVAFVELAPGRKAEPEELIEHCRLSLASFKVPRRVFFVDEWPMSTTKIQKFRLRELAEERVHGRPERKEN